MEDRRLLESWKDIGAYLNRSVVTCHRWEEELGLPVHRLDGTPKARVFAYANELDRWKAEKLHEHEARTTAEERPRETRKSAKWMWIVSGGALALAAAAAVLVWQLVFRAPVPVPAQVPTLGVLAFENNTGDPAWDAWKKALPFLITSDLRQSKLLDPMRRSYFENAIGPLANAEKFSSEDLKKVAEKADVDYALTGRITKSGEDFVINALLHNARTGDVIASPRFTFRNADGIFSSVDRLSKAVKAGLNFTPRQIRGDIDRPVARIMTKSPEAFLLYSQAYGVQGKQKFDEAIAPLLKAVELDPNFVMAFWMLGLTCHNMARKEDAQRYGETAVRLATRIGKRDRERFLIDFFSVTQPDKNKTVQALQRLEKDYPFDPYLLQLSDFYTGREEWEKAIPILEKSLNYKNDPHIILALSANYQSVGLYDKAEKLLDEYIEANPSDRIIQSFWLSRLRLALVQKEFDVAHDFADRMKTAFPNLTSGPSWKGNVYFRQDDYTNAEKMYQKLAEKDDKRTRRNGFAFQAAVSLSRGQVEEARQRLHRALELDRSMDPPYRYLEGEDHLFLAYLERLSGRLPEALKEAELACGSPEGPPLTYVQRMYLRALITLEMNRFEEFEKQAGEIKKYLDPDRSPDIPPKFMRLYYNLLGHRELQKADYQEAIRYFWKALDLISVFSSNSVDGDHAKYFYDLAEAYRLRRDGIPDEPARSMYEKVVLPTISRMSSGDLYARSFYWMGHFWEHSTSNPGSPAPAQERRIKAIENYRKFLDLWKDADPIFTEVEDAKARLARLEAQAGSLASR